MRNPKEIPQESLYHAFLTLKEMNINWGKSKIDTIFRNALLSVVRVEQKIVKINPVIAADTLCGVRIILTGEGPVDFIIGIPLIQDGEGFRYIGKPNKKEIVKKDYTYSRIS